jgi:hypothetical protein
MVAEPRYGRTRQPPPCGEHLTETLMHRHMRSALRAAVRASAPRPISARRAAQDFNQPLLAAVRSEIRWAFKPPCTWLSGVAANMFLAVAWLLIHPLASFGYLAHHYSDVHLDWVILIGTYFSSFILADVTTTNLIGGDHYRVEKALSDGTPLWRILLIKNLTLIVVVGLPTLAAVVALTLWRETPERLPVTIPNVAVPIVSWLGVGNFISVLHPVASEPLIRRWRQRDDRRRTWHWLLALALPYALYYVADPMGGVEHQLFWTRIPNAIGPVLGRDTKGFVHLGIALAVWMGGSIAAVLWVRKRGLHIR